MGLIDLLRSLFGGKTPEPPTGSAPPDPLGVLQTTLEQHAAELTNLPAPARRQELAQHFHRRIDEKAHVYYDILASHPRKDDATSAHVEAMMLAWYAGHMAGRGWMAPVVAQQAAFGLGRRLRDRLKGLGVDVYDRGAAFSLVIDQVLLEIVEQGLKETAATRSP